MTHTSEAASVAWKEEFAKAAMEYRSAYLGGVPMAYANLLRVAQAAPAASVAQMTDERVSQIAMGVEARHPEFHKVSTAALLAFARDILASVAQGLTDEQILDIASDFSEWTEVGYAISDKVAFARAILDQAAPPAAPASEQDDWRSAVRAACSHLDYPIDAPQRVQDALRALKDSMRTAPPAPATGKSGAEFSAGMAHAAEICDRRETEAWADYERTKSKHAKGEADGLVNAAHAIRAEIVATPPAAEASATIAGMRVVVDPRLAPGEFEIRASAQQDEREARAFEDWLARVCPSGDCEAVQRQWEESSDYADLHDDQQVQAGGEDKRDAERYRFIKRSRLILSGGHTKFGWPISPFGDQCDKYIDAALAREQPQGDSNG